MRLIDADALIERLKPYIDKYGAEEFPYNMVHDAFIYEVEKEPTVDAEPVRHGKWMPLPYDSGGYWKCSSCETPTEASGANLLYKYCPFCGARMDADDYLESDYDYVEVNDD